MIGLDKLKYDFPMFMDQMQPKGYLTRDKECHACWYYAVLAQKNKALATGIDQQIITYKVGEEIPLWMDKNYEKIARSVALIYGLESPEVFLKYKKEVWAEGQRLGIDLTEVLGVQPGSDSKQ